MPQPASPILIAACGNPIAGDDALGPLVAQALAAFNLPDTEVRDLGVHPAGLVDHLAGRTALVVVDAALSPAATPGEIIDVDWFSPERPPLAHDTTLSTHAISIADQIELARRLDLLPPIVRLIAVAIQDTTRGSSACDAVAAAVPLAAKRIAGHVADFAQKPPMSPATAARSTRNSAMTPRQRWLALFDRKTPDRVPTDFWSTPEVLGQLKTHLDCPDSQSLWEKLHIDAPRTVGPRWKLKHHPDDPQAGMWGSRSKRINYGTGVYGENAHSPLAHMTSTSQIHNFLWPSPDDFDYTPITQALQDDDRTRLVQAGGYEPFLLYCNLRGMEQAYEDILLNPEIADAALGHIFDFYHEHNRRIFEAGRGRIDMGYIAEDLGAQTGPLMSLGAYRRFLLPNQKKMADLFRKFDIHIFYHTDGAARPFLPDLIDVVGIEVLNPIQWRCPGMERQSLVQEFGDKVIFHGAVDNQHTLPFGSVDDVRDEVRQNLEIFRVRAGGRYICAPCHNIQPVTPMQNIVAMYQTVHELGSLSP